MPGLTGFTHRNSSSRSELLLKTMARALQHDDAQDISLFHDGEVGLGCVEFGLPTHGPSLVWNRDQTVCLTMDGELFDQGDLYQSLRELGHDLRINNDAELALHMYVEYGANFAGRLNGAFTIAIWDRREQTLILINDHLGTFPLYYAIEHEGLLFASGVRALLADPTLSRRVDSVTLVQMLSFEHALGDRTLIERVKLLPPGSVLTYHQGQVSIHAYWTLEYCDTYPLQTEQSYLERLVFLFRQAATRQQPAGLSAGLLLSGGLDSRMIAGLYADLPSAHKIQSFTFGIPQCDDVRYAKEVAHKVGSTHLSMELKPDYLLAVADEGIRITDGLKSCIHMHALANLEEIAGRVELIYKGYMGDALMGGHLQRRDWAKYADADLTRMAFDHYNTIFPLVEQSKLFSEGFYQITKDNAFESFRSAWAESKAESTANHQDHFDLRQRQRRFIINGVQLVRSRVLVRMPFCDKDLVEFVLKVPPGLRWERYLYRKAFMLMLSDLAKVPWTGTGYPVSSDNLRTVFMQAKERIRWRLRDAGLRWIPVARARPYADYERWTRTVLRSWTENTLLDNITLQRDYFSPEYIRNLVAEHMTGGADHSRKLGVLLTIELWHRQFID